MTSIINLYFGLGRNDSLSGANWMNIQKKCFHFKAKMLSKWLAENDRFVVL